MELTREDLIEKKMGVDRELSILRNSIAEAKRTAAAKGKYLPISELRKMEDDAGRLARKSQQFQLELSRVKSARSIAAQALQEKPFSRYFVLAAKRILEPALYDEISREAEEDRDDALQAETHLVRK